MNEKWLDNTYQLAQRIQESEQLNITTENKKYVENQMRVLAEAVIELYERGFESETDRESQKE